MNELLVTIQALSEREPSAPALEADGETISHGELMLRVRDIALALQELEARTVALLAGNSPGWVLVDLACQFENICLVPIPEFFSDVQVHHREAELEALAQDIGEADSLRRRLHCWRASLKFAKSLLVPGRTKLACTLWG